MQTRRDQLHAYRFMTRRAMSALVTGEPDTVEPPMRRLTITTLSGVMIAIVVAAVFAIVGLLKGGGSDDWKSEGAVVMEEDTGALFVNLDGELYPALNYASAILASGATGPVEIQRVSREDLASEPRGQLIGIPGLPNLMPTAEELVRGPISACSVARTEGVDTTVEVDVEIGSRPAAVLSPEQALYVESFAGKRFLLQRGERMPVSATAESALQIREEPIRVGNAFLTAVPMGPSLATPTVPGQGQRVTLAGQRLWVGQVVAVDDGTFRVVLPDGVAPVSDVQAKLLRTARLDGQRREPVTMPLSEVLDLPEADGLGTVMSGLPETMPTLSSDDQSAGGACAVFSADSAAPEFALPDDAAASAAPTSESESSRLGRADSVVLEPGAGLVAKDANAATVYFIGEPGEAFPAKSMAVLAGFGYGAVEPVILPAELLEILPVGGAFDPAAALTSPR